jgi:hypothetical protein
MWLMVSNMVEGVTVGSAREVERGQSGAEDHLVHLVDARTKHPIFSSVFER